MRLPLPKQQCGWRSAKYGDEAIFFVKIVHDAYLLSHTLDICKRLPA